MALTIPKPPTPPSAPTPPTFDSGETSADTHAKIDAKKLFNMPFKRDENPEEVEKDFSEPEESEEVEEFIPQENIGTKTVTTPETMARDAVANGAGRLTKRTVETPEEKNPADSQSNQKVSQVSPSLNFAMTEDDRGKAVLREFQNEDRQGDSDKSQTLTESPRTVKLNLQESHGGFYWVFAITFALVLSVLFVKKFLLTDKPKLKKSDLFEGTGERLQKAKEKITQPVKTSQPSKPPPPIKTVKPAKLPPKEDEDKGKHFEVRI